MSGRERARIGRRSQLALTRFHDSTIPRFRNSRRMERKRLRKRTASTGVGFTAASAGASFQPWLDQPPWRSLFPLIESSAHLCVCPLDTQQCPHAPLDYPSRTLGPSGASPMTASCWLLSWQLHGLGTTSFLVPVAELASRASRSITCDTPPHLGTMTHQLHQSTPFVPRPLEILTLVMPPSSSAIGAPYMRPDLFQPQHAVLPQAQAPPSAEDLTLYTTLAAYADALDALPLDLTRSFSDLRELDAVLGAHLSSIAAKLQHLTAVIEDPSITPGERLLALKEVAEEARAYKMGGEDKIRVAVNTSETIISHTDYIDPLLDILGSLPALAPMLSPTKYLPRAARGDATGSGIGTSASSSTLAPNGADAGTTHATSGKKSKRAHAPGGASGGADRDKRKAGGDGVATASASAPATAGPTPSKKRKAPGAGPGAASGTTNKSARTAAANVAAAAAVEEEWAASRAAKNEKREGAPSGSTTASKSKRPAPGESRPSAASASARLPRAAHTSGAYIDQDEDDVQSGTSRAARPAGELVRDSRRTGGADDERSSRPARNARGGAAGRGTSAAADADEESSESGLGLSTTRGAGSSRTPRLAQVGSAAGAEPALAPGGGAQPGQAAAAGVEAAGGPGTPGAAAGEEADERRYCFCNNVSYGDMIGCDDDDCEREWFHLGCVGLLKPPQGTWYCEACLERRSRESRNKSKRPKASKGGDKPRLASGKR